MNGNGVLYCANGDKFMGVWKDGKRVQGKHYYADKDRYVDYMINDEKMSNKTSLCSLSNHTIKTA
jgi:hypothetical protein